MGVAENADLIVARLLSAYVDEIGFTSEINELVDELPTPELVRQSRCNSLIRSWQRYQSGELGTQFAGQYADRAKQWWLGVERNRTNRYIDELCKTLVDRWQDVPSFQTPESIDEIRHLERQACLFVPDENAEQVFYDIRIAISEQVKQVAEADRLIADLRRRSKAL